MSAKSDASPGLPLPLQQPSNASPSSSNALVLVPENYRKAQVRKLANVSSVNCKEIFDGLYAMEKGGGNASSFTDVLTSVESVMSKFNAKWYINDAARQYPDGASLYSIDMTDKNPLPGLPANLEASLTANYILGVMLTLIALPLFLIASAYLCKGNRMTSKGQEYTDPEPTAEWDGEYHASPAWYNTPLVKKIYLKVQLFVAIAMEALGCLLGVILLRQSGCQYLRTVHAILDLVGLTLDRNELWYVVLGLPFGILSVILLPFSAYKMLADRCSKCPLKSFINSVEFLAAFTSSALSAILMAFGKNFILNFYQMYWVLINQDPEVEQLKVLCHEDNMD